MRPSRHGYIYVPGEDPGLFADASVGDTICKPDDKPPYIVVSHSTDDVIIGSKWPGTLWKAEVLKALQPQGHTGDYTRALSVNLLACAAIAELFGAHGDKVVAIADAAHTISAERVRQLSGLRSSEAGVRYSNAWKQWLKATGERVDSSSYDGVIGAGRRTGSPIGGGLSVIHAQIYRRAQMIGGPDAIESDPIEDESWLAEPWSSAASVLMDAALAYGAPELFTATARDEMIRPWRSVYGALD